MRGIRPLLAAASQPLAVATALQQGLEPLICGLTRHPKGHADTAHIMRTLKEEGSWLTEWTCPFELIHALAAWIADNNERYLHSALGYKPPRQFEREYHDSHITPFVAS
jgi:hypothetical protein